MRGIDLYNSDGEIASSKRESEKYQETHGEDTY